jgi:hypothetical protein
MPVWRARGAPAAHAALGARRGPAGAAPGRAGAALIRSRVRLAC